MRNLHLAFIILILSLAINSGNVAAAFNQKARPAQPASTEILPRIERYKAPPYPKSLYIDRETYDYRRLGRTPVPPTRTDTLICDIWQRITMDLKLEPKPEEVSEEIIKQAMDVYLKTDWNKIAGYRPWTHWNFIRRLKASDRDRLAGEVAEYIKKKGVRDVPPEAR